MALECTTTVLPTSVSYVIICWSAGQSPQLAGLSEHAYHTVTACTSSVTYKMMLNAGQ